MSNTVSEPFHVRSGRVTVLAVLCIWMGFWAVYFTGRVDLTMDELIQREPHPRWFLVTHGPRTQNECGILLYCIASALLTLAGGFGLLLRRRWAPKVIALGGVAWVVTSLGFLIVAGIVLTRTSMSGPKELSHEGLRWMCYGGCSLVTLAYGVLCVTCLRLPRPRLECGDTVPKSAQSFAILIVWGMLCIAASAVWAEWYWSLWGK
jgi:hypothetical protein